MRQYSLFLTLSLFVIIITYFGYIDCTTIQKIQPYQVPNLIDVISEEILKAQSHVEMTIYDFDSDRILSSILDRCKNGVKFTLFADLFSNNPSNSYCNKVIKECGSQATVIFDSLKVHSKYIVVDDSDVFIGSNNWIDEVDNNIEVMIFSNDTNFVKLASDAFHNIIPKYAPSFPSSSKNNHLSLPSSNNTTTTTTTFSLTRGIISTYVKLINSANTSISGAMFKFTIKEIYDATVEAAKRGVSFYLYLDGVHNNFDGSYPNMLKEKFPTLVTLIYSPNDAKMHCKYILFDSNLLAMGSPNWSPGSEENLEDLVLSTDPSLVSQAQQNLKLLVDQNPTTF